MTTEPRCGLRKPGGTSTCTEPAGHNGSHGDGSVIRWIYRDEQASTEPAKKAQHMNDDPTLITDWLKRKVRAQADRYRAAQEELDEAIAYARSVGVDNDEIQAVLDAGRPRWNDGGAS